MSGDLEVPRPLRLILTAGWNLTESVGLPVAAYAVAAWADGRDAGMIAGLVAIWVTAVIRKVVTGSVPSLLTITAIELTVQAAVVLATGQLWLFLLQFPLANLAMCVLFARTARGPDPLVARLAAEVVALRQILTIGVFSNQRLLLADECRKAIVRHRRGGPPPICRSVGQLYVYDNPLLKRPLSCRT